MDERRILRYVSKAFLALVFLAAGISSSLGQGETIRIKTDLVSVPVTVTDRQGRYISTLQKDNFEVFEDGIHQEITLFDAVDEPFTVLILLDRSGSMSFHLQELAKAASIFVGQLRRNDTVMAATFADYVDVLFEPTKVSELKVPAKIRQRADDKYTRIYDAVAFALKRMRKIPGRKAILVFSDGQGDGLYASANETLRSAEEGDALIYTIQYDTSQTISPANRNKEKTAKLLQKASEYMEGLASKTGGKSYKIENITDLAATFRLIADEIGRQYRLGYYPSRLPSTGERRRIRVKVNVPDVAVHSKGEVVFKPR